ncbi:hypothetical protein OG729_10030 [Streptomyces sp. NBC_00210]|uniref:hypothetical protein n=1 Tax=Streptomyces sp. NBC_00210 TaxID=2903636 RepID=UPI003252EE6D
MAAPNWARLRSVTPECAGAFHEHLHREPGRFEQSGDVPGFEEAEIEVHVMSPQLVQMPDLLTDVEGEEEKSGRA